MIEWVIAFDFSFITAANNEFAVKQSSQLSMMGNRHLIIDNLYQKNYIIDICPYQENVIMMEHRSPSRPGLRRNSIVKNFTKYHLTTVASLFPMSPK